MVEDVEELGAEPRALPVTAQAQTEMVRAALLCPPPTSATWMSTAEMPQNCQRVEPLGNSFQAVQAARCGLQHLKDLPFDGCVSD